MAMFLKQIFREIGTYLKVVPKNNVLRHCVQSSVFLPFLFIASLFLFSEFSFASLCEPSQFVNSRCSSGCAVASASGGSCTTTPCPSGQDEWPVGSGTCVSSECKPYQVRDSSGNCACPTGQTVNNICASGCTSGGACVSITCSATRSGQLLRCVSGCGFTALGNAVSCHGSNSSVNPAGRCASCPSGEEEYPENSGTCVPECRNDQIRDVDGNCACPEGQTEQAGVCTGTEDACSCGPNYALHGTTNSCKLLCRSESNGPIDGWVLSSSGMSANVCVPKCSNGETLNCDGTCSPTNCPCPSGQRARINADGSTTCVASCPAGWGLYPTGNAAFGSSEAQFTESCTYCVKTCPPGYQYIDGNCYPPCDNERMRMPPDYECNGICEPIVGVPTCSDDVRIQVGTGGALSCQPGNPDTCSAGWAQANSPDGNTYCLNGCTLEGGSQGLSYTDGNCYSSCANGQMRMPPHYDCNYDVSSCTSCSSTQVLDINNNCVCLPYTEEYPVGSNTCVPECRTDQSRDTNGTCVCPTGYTEQAGACISSGTFVPGAFCRYDHDSRMDDPNMQRLSQGSGGSLCQTSGAKCYRSWQQKGFYRYRPAMNFFQFKTNCVTPDQERDSNYMRELCQLHCGATDPVCNTFASQTSYPMHWGIGGWFYPREGQPLGLSPDSNRGWGKVRFKNLSTDVITESPVQATPFECSSCGTGFSDFSSINIFGGCKLISSCPSTDLIAYDDGTCKNACDTYGPSVANDRISDILDDVGVYWDQNDYMLYAVCLIGGERRGIEKPRGTCTPLCPPGQDVTCEGCAPACPSGESRARGGACCPIGREDDGSGVCVCSDPDEELVGTQCLPVCTNGKIRQGTSCVCPPGESVQADGNCGVPQTAINTPIPTTPIIRGGNPFIPDGVVVNTFNVHGESAYRSVYSIGRASRPDFICWQGTKGNERTNFRRPSLTCPDLATCRTGQICPCRTMNGNKIKGTYCDYSHQDPLRLEHDGNLSLDGSGNTPTNVRLLSVTINVVPTH